MKRALSIVAALAALAAFAAGSPPPPKSGPVTAWLTAGPLVPPKLVYGKESPEEAASRLLGPATLDPAALVAEVHQAVTSFVAGGPQGDDITLVALRWS